MGYRALLFCPDEKTARTVTQVLNELEFTVEACTEPFAAVKKLTGEHLDAIVVDCDNEQNATLLFKSARNSAANQASLAVAVVEGQAGVAKAFRIGANLVLTKPINVEQAKGTLRVARGLLRKGEPAKSHASTQAASVLPPSPATPTDSTKPPIATPRPAASVSASARPATKPVTTTAPWGNQPGPAAAPAAHAPVQDQSAQKITAQKAIATTASVPTLPVPSATQRISAPPIPAPTHKVSSSLSSASSSSGAGAASAPARARIPQESKTEDAVSVEAAGAVEIGNDSKSFASENETSAVSTPDSSPVSSFTFGGAIAQPKAEGGGSKKTLLGVAAAVIAVGFYFGWTQLRRGTNSESATAKTAVAAPTVQPKPSTNSVPPAPASSQAVLSTAVSPVSGPQRESQPSQRIASSNATTGAEKSEGAPDANDDVSKISRANKISGDTSTSVSKPAAEPIVLKNSGTSGSPTASTADAAAPSVLVASGTAGAPLPNLISNSGTSTTPVLQTLNVSQGVSQGLIIRKVQPNYPPSALRLHLEGSVQLMATVGKSGNITGVKIVNGEPLLAQAAMDAVKQWKYKPYLLNGEPVEIQTQVTVNFKLPR